MNPHDFTPSILNALKCAKCFRPESAHGIQAEEVIPENYVFCHDCSKITVPKTPLKSVIACAHCESKNTILKLKSEAECQACSNHDKLVNLSGIWLCQSCIDSEKAAIQKVLDSKPTPIVEENIESDQRPTEIEHASINKLGGQFITKSEDFFNARTVAITTRWAEIVADDTINLENKHYTLAREVREHYLHLKSVLFQAVEVQLECASGQRADQVYLNTLASKLREEERVKLHLQNIDYTPVRPKSAPKAVKLSKDDQIADKYAKIMNIPIETARRLMANKLKEVLGPCTCNETPGICKIHSK